MANVKTTDHAYSDQQLNIFVLSVYVLFTTVNCLLMHALDRSFHRLAENGTEIKRNDSLGCHL